MKKPRRKARRLHAEILFWFGRPLKKHVNNNVPIHSVFLRLNNRRRVFFADDFRKAGYPMAVLPRQAKWKDAHAWCMEQFHNKRGRTYTWTGSLFWFLTQADRDKFVEHFGNVEI